MGRFKFRVWDQEERCMISDASTLIFGNDGLLSGFYASEATDEDDFMDNHRLDEFYPYKGVLEPKHLRFIPLQYTGFSDSEGKEIYEGDYLNGFLCSPGDGEVFFSERTGTWRFKDKSCSLADCIGRKYLISSNIYQVAQEGEDEGA